MGIEDLKQFNLFPAELEVVALVLKGLTNQQIADIRGHKRSGTTWHLNNIYRKVGVKGRVELIVKYGDRGERKAVGE